jgi:RNA polymerase sigma-70 factor (ECF subfamily)
MSSTAPVREVPRPNAQPAGGPSDAVAILYERYYQRVYGFCLYHLGSREEAEDAAQTTFLSALRALERGVVPQLEANWLFTIARNTCRGRFRSRGRSRARELLSDPHVLEAVSPDLEASGDRLFSLEEALADMPELQRRAIVLREWRGCSYREIAEELELSGPAVETLIFRARRSLAQRLEHPPAARRATGLFSGFGTLLAGLKASLGIGTVGKAGVAVCTAVLAIALGVSSDVSWPSSGPPAGINPPASSPVVQTPIDSAGLFVPAEKGTRIHPPLKQTKATKGGSDAPSPGPGSAPGAEPGGGSAEPVSSVVPGVDPVGAAGSIVDGVGDTVDDVTGTVDEVVGAVADDVNPVLPPNLQLPDLGLN